MESTARCQSSARTSRSLRLPGSVALLAVLLTLLGVPQSAEGQPLPGLPQREADTVRTATVGEPPPVVEDPGSPRASARAFIDLAGRKGDHAAAARYLSLADGDRQRGEQLTRRLRAVLERHLDVDLDALSPSGDGDTRDGLPPGVDRLGEVPDGTGGQDPVFLVRSRDASGHFWAFSPQTVSRIEGWYDALPDRWVREWIPEQLERRGPAGLMWWQWLALPILAALSLAIGRLLGAATRRALARAFARTDVVWDEELLARTSGVLAVLWSLVAAAVLLPWLAMLPAAGQAARSVLAGLATLAAFWALWRGVDVWAAHVTSRPGVADNPSARSVLSAVRNLAKVLVAVGGILATLSVFGYPMSTVLAGLGIGGIALAFGAQKTVENLFGSISLAADQPFRVGDFVRIEDFSGNVERIGMRSTQIRTLDRTLITMPNGKLSDLRIEDFGSRDRIRFATTISLAYGATEAQLVGIVRDVDHLLRSNPKIWPDAVVAKVAAFTPTSIDAEVLCWFQTTDVEEFRNLRQAALLGILRIVREAGASFAHPAQTVLVTGAAGLTPPAASDRDPRPVP
jgi:MscS family membrane protein